VTQHAKEDALSQTSIRVYRRAYAREARRGVGLVSDATAIRRAAVQQTERNQLREVFQPITSRRGPRLQRDEKNVFGIERRVFIGDESPAGNLKPLCVAIPSRILASPESRAIAVAHQASIRR
jgi:hypothetical protein